MKVNYKEPKLTYALDSSGKMVHIGSVKRGLSCNCRCPKCNEFLVAKLGHDGGRQQHFAHRKGSDCSGSYMTALHKLAEQIIEKEKAVMAPAYKNISKQKLSFKNVEVEQRVERKDLQPDIVGITSDGSRWFIEIRNTHEVDEAKRAKLIESNITCLEIDVREQTLENLKSFLLESAENREWINNPIYIKQIEEIYRKKVSEIVKQFVEKPELHPQGDIISLQNLSTFISEDGLYASIKAISSKGIPYLFHIGSQEVLEDIKPTKECNELLIDVDKRHFINGVVSMSNMERLYLYIPKKETELKVRKNKNKTGIRFDNSLPERLPFERFWTIEEYYEQLISSNSYKSEKGLSADIIKIRRITNRILLLYKDPNDVRNYWPYHIVIISVNSGDLIKNKVADFTNRKAAMDSFCERLEAMNSNIYMRSLTGNNDNDLPF